MNQLVSHIEFLLHDHNCVIIPDFGGFVVNTIPARRDGIATFHAPMCELVFNRDLTHNDGLLAQSYMKSDHLTFEAAMLKIEEAVYELKSQLREEHRVELGKLGSFTMNDDKRFLYRPSSFVKPALFGLKKATLKPLIQMQPPLTPEKEINRPKRLRALGVTAASVAAIVMLMFLLPVSDTTLGRQSAQMISESGLFRSGRSSAEVHAASATDLNSDTDNGDQRGGEPSEKELQPTTKTIQNEHEELPEYFVIVGVYEVREVAERMRETLESEGFTSNGWLRRRPGRIDVYAASFHEREEAETYLREVHQEYPTHRDAWILKR